LLDDELNSAHEKSGDGCSPARRHHLQTGSR
jgi:hypothetical protein